MPTYSVCVHRMQQSVRRGAGVQRRCVDHLPRMQWPAAQALRQRGSRVQGQRLLPQRQPRIGQEFVVEFIDVDQRVVRRLGIVDLVVGEVREVGVVGLQQFVRFVRRLGFQLLELRTRRRGIQLVVCPLWTNCFEHHFATAEGFRVVVVGVEVAKRVPCASHRRRRHRDYAVCADFRLDDHRVDPQHRDHHDVRPTGRAAQRPSRQGAVAFGDRDERLHPDRQSRQRETLRR